MYRLKLLVEGVGRGLLMHKFSTQATADMEAKVKKSTRVDPPPPEAAEAVAYRLEPSNGDSKGQLMLPASHFLSAILATGSSMQIKGRGKKTFKDAFKGSLDIVPDYIPLTNENSAPLFDFAIDSRAVRNPSTKGRVIRHRPHIAAGWRAEFTVTVSDDTIPVEVLEAGIADAGQSKCVGDYRPRFGQFRIVSCEKG